MISCHPQPGQGARYPESSWLTLDLAQTNGARHCYIQRLFLRNNSTNNNRYNWMYDGNTALSDLMSYDIVGKLLSKVVEGSGTLMEMRYGYSLAGDRIAQQTDLDSFTYLTDEAGRLVEESHNRFCIDLPVIWKQGQWDLVELDEETRTISLLPFADDFSGTELNLQRWKLENRQYKRVNVQDNLNDMAELDAVGMEIRQNGALRMNYPRALHNQSYWHRAPVDNHIGIDAGMFPYHAAYPEFVLPKQWWIDLFHNQKLVGDFDIAVDYNRVRGNYDVPELVGFQLAVSPTCLDPIDTTETWLAVQVFREAWYPHLMFTKTSPAGQQRLEYNFTEPGEIRLTRTGTTYQAYFRTQGEPTWQSAGTYTGSAADLNLYLNFTSRSCGGQAEVTNLRRLSGMLCRRKARSFPESTTPGELFLGTAFSGTRTCPPAAT